MQERRVTFAPDQNQVDPAEENLHKNHPGAIKGHKEARREQLFYFQKFQTLNFYYKQVNKTLGPGFVPNFYRFKIAPIEAPTLSRVFEVEEHVGRVFIEELAEMHLAHLKSKENAKKQR